MISSKFLGCARLANLQTVKCAMSSVVRFKSTVIAKKDFTLIDVNDKTGIATLTMNSPPVNSLNLELLSSLSKSLDVLHKDNVRGAILTSVRQILILSYKMSNFLLYFSLVKRYFPLA